MVVDIQERFNDLGVDAILGTKMMKAMMVTPVDFIDPARFMKFKETLDFFKKYPELEYKIEKICLAKMVDRLEHVWGYTNLLTQKMAKEESMKSLNEKKSMLEMTNEDFSEVDQNIQSEQRVINQLSEQIFAYE